MAGEPRTGTDVEYEGWSGEVQEGESSVGHLRLNVLDTRVCVVFLGGGVIVVKVRRATVVLVELSSSVSDIITGYLLDATLRKLYV